MTDHHEPTDAEIAQAQLDLERVRREAEELGIAAAERETGSSLVLVGGNDPVKIKASMVELRANITKKSMELREAANHLEQLLSDKIEAAKRFMEPLEEQMALLHEGIATANLYLGRDEEITTLREGNPAPADTPITVRQMVLAMDQESMIAAEEGGVDARSTADFDQWLLDDPAHLDQVLPEPKGVVALVPRWDPKNYSDPWVMKAVADANHTTHWLIRNGERLSVMTTDLWVGKNLIPTTDEFTSFFEEKVFDHASGEYKKSPIEPGTWKWAEAEKAAGARQRHFMRVALVLQGLMDRTTVFHPLPPQGVNLLSPDSYDQGVVNVVADANLTLASGREPFRAWLRRLNSQLRPGMRIVGGFNAWELGKVLRGDEYGGRISPRNASFPETGTIYTLEAATGWDGDLKFFYERTDKRYGYEHPENGGWGRWGEWPYKNRASCVVDRDDGWILPYDLVTIEEMEDYIAARTERHAYLEMIPLMKSAIAAKKAEREEEAPFRAMLAGALVTQNGADPEDAETAVVALVDWWKLANRWHRPLVDPDPETQAKAVRMIVAEDAARRGVTHDSDKEEAMVAKLRSEYPDLMGVARRRDGWYVGIEPMMEGSPYVRFVTMSKTGRSKKVEDWQIVGTRWERNWRPLWSDKRWAGWDREGSAKTHLTGPEIDAVVEEIKARYADLDGQVEKSWGRYGGEVEGSNEGWNLAAITMSSKAPQIFYAHFVRTRDIVEPALLISDPMPYVGVFDEKVRWERRSREVSLSWPDQLRPDDGSRNGKFTWVFDAKSPYRYHGDVLLWEDAVVTGAAFKAAGLISEWTERSEALEGCVRRAKNSVAAEWQRREEARIFERFLEDYGDASLWEGHKKTLRGGLPRFNFHEDGGLGDALGHLIERGYDVSGMTVEQMAILHAKLGLPEGYEAAEDVADIVISAPSSGDDDDF